MQLPETRARSGARPPHESRGEAVMRLTVQELEEEERQNGRARFLAEVAAQRRQNAEEDGEAA